MRKQLKPYLNREHITENRASLLIIYDSFFKNLYFNYKKLQIILYPKINQIQTIKPQNHLYN